jgi:hypothetical protein
MRRVEEKIRANGCGDSSSLRKRGQRIQTLTSRLKVRSSKSSPILSPISLLQLFSMISADNNQIRTTSSRNPAASVAGLLPKRRLYGTTRWGGVLRSGGGYGSVFKLSVVRPVLAVTKPHQHAHVIEPVITVTGKSKPKIITPITKVFFQINGSEWAEAASNDGWTNWTARVMLIPGTKTFRAYAVDAIQDTSRTNVMRFRFQGN